MRAWTTLTLVMILMLAGTGRATAQRQSYSRSWELASSGGYYFRDYLFKPDPAQMKPDRHHCIYYPSQPSYFYYYNSAAELYWARYNLKTERFEVLPEQDRRKRLSDIKESAFREQRDPPPIPGARDGVRMEKPPTDLPTRKKEK